MKTTIGPQSPDLEEKGKQGIPAKLYAADMPRVQLILLLLGLSTVTFLFALDQTVVATAQPKIAADFQAFGLISWIATAYLLPTTALQPFYGKISDIFGRQLVMLYCVTIFVIGSVVCAAAPSMIALIIGRVVAGVGGAGLLNLCFIILSDMTTERERTSYMNIINLVFVITDCLGPLIGGVFTDSVTWRWCFWINLIAYPFIAIIIVRYIKLPIPGGTLQEKLKRIDFLGMSTMTIFLVAFLLAMSWGGTEYAWNSPMIISLLVVTAVFIVAFVLIEHYVAREPVLPLRLLQWKFRNFPIILIARAATFFILFAVVFYIPLYFQIVHQSSAIISGIHLFPFLFGACISSLFANYLTKRFGIYRSLNIAGLGVLAIAMGLTSTLSRSSNLGQQIGYLLIGGLGFGLTTQTQLIAAQAGVRRQDIGTVTAVANMMCNLGGCISIAVIGSIIGNIFETKVTAQMAGLDVVINALSPEVLAKLTIDQRIIVVDAYVEAIQNGFRFLLGVALFGFVTCFGLEHRQLGDSKREDDEGDSTQVEV
ncbi:hypothetical protein K7432_008149 [Basidiobolus ranarum]|uniref:Major facilitator superfamily (MFS) profile domain-containing protein n=1 Tax=Basidiobolus ranarum TaxID=34480 RepID=A0ABR2VZ25_9FUNG